jgi:hypothetical protein
MKEEFLCDMCNVPMKCIKTIGTKQSGKKYRQRWFQCPVCDFIKKVHACGVIDEIIKPEQAINAINKQFKKEEKAREL